ncbi:MAG TPA: hemerythrin domain-containing protein [Bryobacteraceae bacterium]|nr:hemerythrin domain-containing protein [Bryobacteraceae bacterium]
MTTIAETLKAVALFAPLSEAELQFLAARSRLKSYSAGERLFGEGDPAPAYTSSPAGACESLRRQPMGANTRSRSSAQVARLPNCRLLGDGALPAGCFGSVDTTSVKPIARMMADHDEAGTLLARLRSLAGDFRPPDEACPSFRRLYAGLEEFERDLHRHIHLENNILFPRAVALERSLREKR